MNKALLRRSIGLAVLVLGGIGSSALMAQSAMTPEQLTVRVERMDQSTKRSEAALANIQAQMKQLADDMARLGRLIDNRAMLDMIQQVDEVASEVSQLNGAIEQQTFDIEEIKKRQRELYLDIDRRLRDLESRNSGQAPAASINIPQVTTPSIGLPANSSEASSSQAEVEAEVEIPQSSGPSLTQSEEKAAYQAAFDTLKEGRYKKAKTELSTFLDRFPNSSFAGNAQYWLGEAHYVTRNFDQGIVEFEKVLKLYPSSNKVPDAMLKLGYTFYELKQFEQAKATLQLLRERFPKATAARLAAKRLDRIRKEGH